MLMPRELSSCCAYTTAVLSGEMPRAQATGHRVDHPKNPPDLRDPPRQARDHDHRGPNERQDQGIVTSYSENLFCFVF